MDVSDYTNRQARTMTDITNPRLLYAKGFLFLVCGFLAVGLLLWEHPEAKVIMLVAIAVWCFSRCYYFAFYVIQHYIDPTYRFAGLIAFARYVVRRLRRRT